MKQPPLPIHSSPPKKTNFPIEGNLHLEGNHPTSVWINIFPGTDPNKPVAGFALTKDGDYYSDIEWIRRVTGDDDDFGKFITFHLWPTVVGMDCDLTYSVRYDIDGEGEGFSKIDLCIPAATWPAVFNFGVEPAGVTTTSGQPITLIDPKIIITPIGATL